ncbi:MAG: hypothetical protein LBQ60_18405 [Bacteroidales bacterium]|jgi:hypothetical protein|nr:hypothetical protein [Bacteroidales bacterium]
MIAFFSASVSLAQTEALPAYFSDPEYQSAMRNALSFQRQADSVLRIVEKKTQAILSAQDSVKAELRNEIRDNHALSLDLQKKADEWFLKANEYTGKEKNDVRKDPPVEDKTEKTTPEKPVTERKGKNALVSEFAILTASPYSSANPIPIDPPLPDGVVYKIQLGAYSKPIQSHTFKGLSPVSGEKLSSGVIKYYVGLFYTYDETEEALRKVKEYGYKDAYLVAFYNKKSIIPNRARELEKNRN